MKSTKVKLFKFAAIVSTLTMGIAPSTNVLASDVTPIETEPQSEIEFNKNQLKEIQQYVTVNNQGHLALEESVPLNIYEQYELHKLEHHFSTVNSQVDKGTIVVNDDLTIREQAANDHMVSIMASPGEGVTHHQTWYGGNSIYTNAATIRAVNAFTTIAWTTTIGAGVANSWFPPFAAGAIVSGGYMGLLGHRMDVNNNGNGVEVRMTYALVYNVVSR
ncbi:MAG: hypothetical protein R6U02_00665 [Alkalibacterium sp.]|uniref:hypothetical protein n=1 Tax=Alkalibacterium sp. TaxID=1872447 RepID=UPI0039704B49